MKEYIKRMLSNIVTLWYYVTLAVLIMAILGVTTCWPIYPAVRTGIDAWWWLLIITIPVGVTITYDVIEWAYKRFGL